MTKSNFKNRCFRVVSITVLSLLFGCVRMVPLQEGIVLPSNSLKTINQKILVVMDKPSSEKVIVFKPGAFSDKFSLKGGESVKTNVLGFVSSQFQEVNFTNELSEEKNNYNYYLKIDWKDYKIDMGKTIFSDTKVNLYIDYHLLNSEKEMLFTLVTDGSSVKGLSSDAIVTAINPFVFVATNKAEELIANSWNEALANSINMFRLELENYSNKE
jgi:hypothetical protein